MRDEKKNDRNKYEKRGPDGAVLLHGPSDTEEAEASREQRHKTQRETLQLWFNGILMVATIGLAITSKLQWDAAKSSADAAKRAADVANQTLNEIKRGGTDTHELAAAAKAQAENTGRMAHIASDQLNALRRANDQTEAALRISERAYLITQPVALEDANKGLLSLPINNAGRLPSGGAQITIHEATFNASNPNERPTTESVVEKHWDSHNIQAVPPGGGYSVGIYLSAYSKDKLYSGHQKVVGAGEMVYDDGFARDGKQTWLFCFESIYQIRIERLVWSPCNATLLLPDLTVVDGYPQHK